MNMTAMHDRHIEIMLPTMGERDSIGIQIESIRTQSHRNFRLNILADGFYSRVIQTVGPLFKNERIIEVPEGPRGNVGHRAVRWALENFCDLHGWLYIVGDDDFVYPDALQLFMDHSEGVSVVMGVVQCVARKDPHHHMGLLGDGAIQCGYVTGSGCIYKLDDLKKLEEPWYQDLTYESDWVLISRMIERFAFRRIPNIVYRLAYH